MKHLVLSGKYLEVSVSKQESWSRTPWPGLFLLQNAVGLYHLRCKTDYHSFDYFSISNTASKKLAQSLKPPELVFYLEKCAHSICICEIYHLQSEVMLSLLSSL